MSSTPELAELIRLSRAVGADPDWVQGGGGNTSVKSADRRSIWVKTSGTALAEMDETRGWAELDLPATLAILTAPGLARLSPKSREEQVLALLLSSVRRPGSPVRPSVESSLHALLDRVVIHSHPVQLTAFLASQDSRARYGSLLAAIVDAPLYVAYVDPGYTLAAKLREEIDDYLQRHGRRPRVVLLENHGLFVAGDDVEPVLALHEQVAAAGRRWAGGRRVNPLRFHFVVDEAAPSEYPTCGNDLVAPTPVARGASAASAAEQAGMTVTTAHVRGALLRGGARPTLVRRDDSPTALALLQDEAALRGAGEGAFTPDQIVYCKTFPVVFEPGRFPQVLPAWCSTVHAYRERHGLDPKVVIAPGLGIFHAAPGLAQLRVVAETHRLAMTTLLCSGRAGGPRFLDRRQAGFIEEWEVESFRAQLLRGRAQLLEGRVALLCDAGTEAGRAAAKALLDEGATVFACVGAGVAALPPPTPVAAGRWLTLSVDARAPGAAQRALALLEESVGGLDFVVATQGIAVGEGSLVGAAAHLLRKQFAGGAIALLGADGLRTSQDLEVVGSATAEALRHTPGNNGIRVSALDANPDAPTLLGALLAGR